LIVATAAIQPSFFYKPTNRNASAMRGKPRIAAEITATEMMVAAIHRPGCDLRRYIRPFGPMNVLMTTPDLSQQPR
jgi:hypothetical protein